MSANDFEYELKRRRKRQLLLHFLRSVFSCLLNCCILSLFYFFIFLGLQIIPVVTKIDLPSSQPEETALAMGTTFQVG